MTILAIIVGFALITLGAENNISERGRKWLNVLGWICLTIGTAELLWLSMVQISALAREIL
jgi:uncharacterized membrane protein